MINTLRNVNQFSKDKPKILITQELRDTEKQQMLWSEFYKKLINYFDVSKIDRSKQHEEYNSDDILMLNCNLKS